MGAGLPPEGRDGCLAGSPLAGRPVPGLGPHAAAFAGSGGWGEKPAGLRVGGAWSPVPAPQPLGAARDGGGGLERTSSSSTGDICSKSGRGERRLTPRSERRGPQQRPTPPAGTFGLGADGGGGGRGRSRRVSRVTTPMKFPIVGGRAGGGGAKNRPPPPSPPPQPLLLWGHLISLPADASAWFAEEAPGVTEAPLRALQTIPRPQRKQGEGRRAPRRPFYM